MSDFKAKMYKIRFPLGLRPRPRSRCLQRSPRSPSYLRGLLLRGGGKSERRGRGGTEKGRICRTIVKLLPTRLFKLFWQPVECLFGYTL